MKRFNLGHVLLLSYVISTFSEGVILPVYAIFVQGIGGNVLDAGIAMGIFLAFDGIFTFFIHNKKKKRTHKQRIKIMIEGWFVWLVGISFYLVISNKWTLFAAQIFIALGNALADPVYDEEFSDNASKLDPEKEWGLFEGGKSIVGGISAVAGGAIVAVFGFNVLIYTMVVTATISCILVVYYVKKVKK